MLYIYIYTHTYKIYDKENTTGFRCLFKCLRYQKAVVFECRVLVIPTFQKLQYTLENIYVYNAL